MLSLHTVYLRGGWKLVDYICSRTTSVWRRWSKNIDDGEGDDNNGNRNDDVACGDEHCLGVIMFMVKAMVLIRVMVNIFDGGVGNDGQK